ncbi:MAG: hypothetical protein J6X44_06755, partial [Thermoguttaceae bacterium]|nr:hypothetical protein [Thermoguttaceae bacterium]
MTIMNCIVSNNNSEDGGGIKTFNTELIITNSSFVGNTGGGISTYCTTATITNVVVSQNSGIVCGGISMSGATSIENCSISGNSSRRRGGGIIAQGTTSIANSSISSNNSSGNGGGIFANGTMIITNSVFSQNSAVDGGGGGICANTCQLTLNNCLLSENSATSDLGYNMNTPYGRGGGVYATQSSLSITNSSISKNFATRDGGGIYADPQSPGSIYNSIVAINSKGDLYGSFNGDCVLTSDVSKVNGEKIYEYVQNLPLFIDSENGDYRLTENSQAIDLGNNEYAHSIDLDDNSKDLANNPRFVGKTIDIGAYEYVSYTATGQTFVWVGVVNFEFTHEIQNATNVSVKWTNGIETGNFGLFDLSGSFTLDTSLYPDGQFKLSFDYLDDSGAIIFTEDKTATIINDESIIVKRGDVTTDEKWSSDKVYLVVGELNVTSGTKLTINEGTVVKFWEGGYINVESDSNVDVRNRVVFTRAEDDVVIGDTNKDGILSIPKIGASYFRGAGLDGVSIDNTVVFKYLVETRFGQIAQDETWISGRVYRITDDLIIAKGVTLTIEPGTILKFDHHCSLIVEENAQLIAQGETLRPIVFTSIHDDEYGGDIDEEDKRPDGGDWSKIHCKSRGTIYFDHCLIRYCSDIFNQAGGIFLDGSDSFVTFNNSRISFTAYDEIKNWGGVFSAYNSIFDNS